MFRRALLGAAVSAVLGSSVGHASGFSNTYFFGDSLSDAGTFSFALPSGTGKFTTNPGPVWTENLAAALRGDARPAIDGGNNFAVGGARVTELPGVPDSNPLTANALPLRDQISAHLAGAGRADANALYMVWGGADDVLRAIDPSKPESADPLGYLLLTAGQLGEEIAGLRAAGARYVLVPAVPDVGVTPFGVSLGPAGAAAASGLVGAYNQALFADLAAAGLRVIPLDTFTLLHEVIADPARYGLSNVMDAACGTTSSLLCTASDLVAPDAAQTHLFADGVHPTSAGHRLLSDYALGVLRAPASVSLLAESPLVARHALFATIDDQATRVGESSPLATHVWASAGGGRVEYEPDAELAGSRGDRRELALGVDRRLTPRLRLGVALAAQRSEPDFVDGGRYEEDEKAVALYAVYRAKAWHATAVAASGRLDFATRRTVALGAAQRVMHGDTDGRNRSLGLLVGYEFGSAALRHGPVVGMQIQRIRIDAFAEDGSTSTAMGFDVQRRDSRVGSLGYQWRLEGERLSPYARLTVDREFEDEERAVGAYLKTVPDNRFELPAVTLDRTYATAVAGFGYRLGRATSVGLALSGRFGQDDARVYAVQAGINVGF